MCLFSRNPLVYAYPRSQSRASFPKTELQACMLCTGVFDLTRFRVTVAVRGEVMGVTQPATQCLMTVVPASA